MPKTTTKKTERKNINNGILGKGLDGSIEAKKSMLNITHAIQKLFKNYGFIRDVEFEFSMYKNTNQQLAYTLKNDHVHTTQPITTIKYWLGHKSFKIDTKNPNGKRTFSDNELVEILGTFIASIGLAQMPPNKRFNKATNYSDHTRTYLEPLGIIFDLDKQNRIKNRSLKFNTDLLMPMVEQLRTDLEVITSIKVSSEYVAPTESTNASKRNRLYCSEGCDGNEVLISVSEENIKTVQLMFPSGCMICYKSFGEIVHINTEKTPKPKAKKVVKQAEKIVAKSAK